MQDSELRAALRAAARPLTGDPDDYDALLTAVGEARLVLLGVAAHGVREFQRARIAITRRLIAEQGFTAVAVAGSAVAAARVDRHGRGHGDDADADAALADFARFPAWPWRNEAVRAFVDWLRDYNAAHPRAPAGFYGLDRYGLDDAREVALATLRRLDPVGVAAAVRRCENFDHCVEALPPGPDIGLNLTRSREEEIVARLCATQRARQRATHEYDAQEAAEYYRALFRGRSEAWNRHETHLADSLEALLERLGERAKIVVWAHNAQAGDVRATEHGCFNQRNLGQLARERHGAAVFAIGCTAYRGTVTTADGWECASERRRLAPALPRSYEVLFHDSGLPSFAMVMNGRAAAGSSGSPGSIAARDRAAHGLLAPRLQRSVGVIYQPASERLSHYFFAGLSRQFDAVLHFDETTATRPLDIASPNLDFDAALAAGDLI